MIWTWLPWVSLLSLCSVFASSSASELFIADVRNSSYDAFVPPSVPTVVSVQLSIYKLTAIDTRLQLFSVGVALRQQWVDERLKRAVPPNNTTALVTIEPHSVIWTPDLTLIDAIKCDELNNLIEVNVTSGELEFFCSFFFLRLPNLWQALFFVHEQCGVQSQTNLIFVDFLLMYVRGGPIRVFSHDTGPLQEQNVSIRIVSFTLPMSRVVLKWDENDPLDPLPQESLSSSLWTFRNSSTFTSISPMRRSQNFSVATAVVSISRRTEQYMSKVIVPLATIVTLATGQFYIDRNSAPARIGFSITMTLTVVTFNVFLSNELPRIGYR
jgi:hypothetical protein